MLPFTSYLHVRIYIFLFLFCVYCIIKFNLENCLYIFKKKLKLKLASFFLEIRFDLMKLQICLKSFQSSYIFIILCKIKKNRSKK